MLATEYKHNFSNTPLDYLKHASALPLETHTRRGMDLLKVQCSINKCEFENLKFGYANIISTYWIIREVGVIVKSDCVQKVERKFQNRALLGKTHCYGWFPYHVDPNYNVILCGFFYLSGSFKAMPLPKNCDFKKLINRVLQLVFVNLNLTDLQWKLVNSVLTRMNYCNSFYCNFLTVNQKHKLQVMQNASLRFLFNIKLREHLLLLRPQNLTFRFLLPIFLLLLL